MNRNSTTPNCSSAISNDERSNRFYLRVKDILQHRFHALDPQHPGRPAPSSRRSLSSLTTRIPGLRSRNSVNVARPAPVLRDDASVFTSFPLSDSGLRSPGRRTRRDAIDLGGVRPAITDIARGVVDSESVHRGRSRWTRVPVPGHDEEPAEGEPAPVYPGRDCGLPGYEEDEWVVFLEHEDAERYTFVRKSSL
ncbi:MAG: hypothetical protein Q9222_007077 [Ikaeria aurantiellina]